MKVGDVVEVKEKSKQLALVLEATALAERDVPDYIEVDHTKMTAKLTPRAGAGRRALPGDDGAAPGGRVLLALESSAKLVRHENRRYLSPASWARFADNCGETRRFSRVLRHAT